MKPKKKFVAVHVRSIDKSVATPGAGHVRYSTECERLTGHTGGLWATIGNINVQVRWSRLAKQIFVVLLVLGVVMLLTACNSLPRAVNLRKPAAKATITAVNTPAPAIAAPPQEQSDNSAWPLIGVLGATCFVAGWIAGVITPSLLSGKKNGQR